MTNTENRIEATKATESKLIANMGRDELAARLEGAFAERAAATDVDRIAGWDARIEVISEALTALTR